MLPEQIRVPAPPGRLQGPSSCAPVGQSTPTPQASTAPCTPRVCEDHDLPWQQLPDPAIVSPSWGLQGSSWGPAQPNPARTAKDGVYRPVFPADGSQCPEEGKLTPNSTTIVSTLENTSGCKLLFLIVVSDQGFT